MNSQRSQHCSLGLPGHRSHPAVYGSHAKSLHEHKLRWDQKNCSKQLTALPSHGESHGFWILCARNTEQRAHIVHVTPAGLSGPRGRLRKQVSCRQGAHKVLAGSFLCVPMDGKNPCLLPSSHLFSQGVWSQESKTSTHRAARSRRLARD